MKKEAKQRDCAGRLSGGALAIIVLLPVALFILGLGAGRMRIPLGDVAASLLSRVGLAEPAARQIDTVIWSIRVPRLLLAALVGAGLAVSGGTYQSLFANPLATPDTLGVASGASFGAAAAMLLGVRGIGIQACALLCGLAAVSLTTLAARGLGARSSTPILAGIMVGSLFSALVSLIKFTADTESELPAITYWLMGGLESADYKSLLLGAPPILIGVMLLLLVRWRMNLLILLEDEATSSGADAVRLRALCQISATVITASCVSMCGQVGWVGLLVPHICRMKLGSNNVSLLPACVGIGAAFMIVVDTAARTLSAKEIPISILTAIVGAPFFIYLLRKNRGWSL